MRDHFPFWRSLTTTVLIVSVFAVWDWAIIHIATVNFEDRAHQQRECRVVAEIARASLPEFAPINAARANEGLPPVTIGVNPRLWTHVTREGADTIFPAHLPLRLRPLLQLVPPLACTGEFRYQGVPVMTTPAPRWNDETGARAIEIIFSRIVFSPDGREAYVERGSFCGGLCGEGFDTVWRLQNGRWVMVHKRATWIS